MELATSPAHLGFLYPPGILHTAASFQPRLKGIAVMCSVGYLPCTMSGCVLCMLVTYLAEGLLDLRNTPHPPLCLACECMSVGCDMVVPDAQLPRHSLAVGQLLPAPLSALPLRLRSPLPSASTAPPRSLLCLCVPLHACLCWLLLPPTRSWRWHRLCLLAPLCCIANGVVTWVNPHHNVIGLVGGFRAAAWQSTAANMRWYAGELLGCLAMCLRRRLWHIKHTVDGKSICANEALESATATQL